MLGKIFDVFLQARTERHHSWEKTTKRLGAGTFFQITLPQHSTLKKTPKIALKNPQSAQESETTTLPSTKLPTKWHPVGESNPCRRNENPVSWPLDEQGKQRTYSKRWDKERQAFLQPPHFIRTLQTKITCAFFKKRHERHHTPPLTYTEFSVWTYSYQFDTRQPNPFAG